MPDNISFEDAIVQGVVAQFFQPIIGGTTSDGQIWFQTPPVQAMGYRLFNDKRDEIFALLAEKIDMNTLADAIAESLFKSLNEKPWFGADWWATQERKDLRERVLNAVATKKAEQLMAEEDATHQVRDEEG